MCFLLQPSLPDTPTRDNLRRLNMRFCLQPLSPLSPKQITWRCLIVCFCCSWYKQTVKDKKLALLNAKPENVRREAQIIAQAGLPGAVTIATNMAGRGTDIVLGGNPKGLALQVLMKLFAHYFISGQWEDPSFVCPLLHLRSVKGPLLCLPFTSSQVSGRIPLLFAHVCISGQSKDLSFVCPLPHLRSGAGLHYKRLLCVHNSQCYMSNKHDTLHTCLYKA